jgi:cysteine desulfurase
MSDRFVYLDNAATTAVSPLVLEKMLPYFHERYGNPSSAYSIAHTTQQAIEGARESVANALGAKSNEIFFTGSGTEADNWAIKGAAAANMKKGRHIITSAIEHHAVLETCEYLQKHGFQVTFLHVDEYGFISPDTLAQAIQKDTVLISIMMANNEIGTIEPIQDLAGVAHERGVLFHADAVQAAGFLDIDVTKLNVDMLSIAAHKFYGPKGVGALYVRTGTKLDCFMHGGTQERGKRAGTENVAGIVGLAEALKLAITKMDVTNAKLCALRDRTIREVLENIPHVRLNGHPTQRLPNNVNFAFRYIEGESILLMLNSKGIAASSGSACTSGSLDPSHVLLAIGLAPEIAHGSLRLTFGAENTEDDVDYLLESLTPIIQRLRDMSPLHRAND